MGSRGILSTRHGSGQVVGEDDRNGRAVVHRIQQAGHAAVGKGGIADDRHGRENTRIGGALRHRNGGSHIHAGIDGPEGRQGPQGIAADIAEDPGRGEVGQDLVQDRINVAMAAALAQLGRTGRQVQGRREGSGLRLA